MTDRKKYRFNANLICLIVAFALIVINVFSVFVASKIVFKLDLTNDKVLDFSDKTNETLKNLKYPVKVYGFLPETSNDALNDIKSIMEKYVKTNKYISYKEIDANKNPSFLSKYQVNGENLTDYCYVFETDKRYKVVSLNDTYTSDENTGNVYIKAETEFTNAINFVTGDKIINIAVLNGHGETLTAEYLTNLLVGENYTFEDINLMVDEIPNDTDLLILSEPKTDFDLSEITKIDEYLRKGKNIQYYNSSAEKGTGTLIEYFAKMGISFTKGVVYENDSSKYVSNPSMIIPSYGNIEFLNPIKDNNLSIMVPAPTAIITNPVDGYEYVNILETSENSVVKMNDDAKTYNYENGDIKGPATLCEMVTVNFENGKTALVLFNSGMYMLNGQYFLQSSFANKDFVCNSMNYMLGDTSNFGISAKNITPLQVSVSANSTFIYTIIFVLLIPIILIVFGIVVWNKRRHL